MERSEILDKIYLVNDKIKPEIKTGYKLSVSKFLDMLKEPFDKEAVAHKCYLNALKDPEKYPKYVGMTEEQIIASWDAKSTTSKKYGCLLDDYIGSVIDGEKCPVVDNDDERGNNLISGFNAFYSKFSKIPGLVFVGREIPIYVKTEGLYVSGRLDALFLHEGTNSLVLIDWKNTEEITKSNKFQKLKGPLSRFDDCNLNVYSMQLNLYIRALIETYGIIKDATQVTPYVVQIRGQEIFDDTKEYYTIHKPSIMYNSMLMDDTIGYIKRSINK